MGHGPLLRAVRLMASRRMPKGESVSKDSKVNVVEVDVAVNV
jgi:hypothetical protein